MSTPIESGPPKDTAAIAIPVVANGGPANGDIARMLNSPEAAQWRSSGIQVDVRDQSWGMKAPERVCRPRPNLARRAC